MELPKKSLVSSEKASASVRVYLLYGASECVSYRDRYALLVLSPTSKDLTRFEKLRISTV